MQSDGAALNMVLRIFLRVISQSLQTHCPGAAQVDKAALLIGAVAFIHRFGSSLNGHVHFHVCVVDGVFLDAGAVANTPGALQAKVGVGVGARWRSPVGPLQIDLAYGVQVRRFRLHLNVGFNF